MEMFFSAIASVAWFLLYMAGVFAGFVGSFFNTVVFYTVFQMGHIVAALGDGPDNAIVLAWTLTRDIVNIFLIFGILYTGALLILGVQKGEYLRTVAYIIIAALLVNFSLFFTKFVIEISNMAAIQIYKTTVNEGEQGCATATAGSSFLATLLYCASGGYAGAFFHELNLTSLYQEEKPVNGNAGLNAEDYKRQAAMFFGGAVFLVVLGVVLLSAGLMLLVRFLYLLILMILSPFAFVAWAIPNLQGYWNMWWGKLLRESFFAPLFFLGLWVTLLFINRIKTTFSNDSITYAQAFTGEMQGYALVFLFAVAIGLLWGSLMLARKVSASWGDERFSKVHGFLQNNKGKMFAATMGFGLSGGSALGAAAGAAVVKPLQAVVRRQVGGVGKFLQKKGEEKTHKWVAKQAQLKKEGKWGRAALYSALAVPTAQYLTDIGQVLYTGQGEAAKGALGGVLKVLAKSGLKQSLSEYERDIERLYIAAAVSLARKDPPPEIQELASRWDAKVTARQEARNQVEEQLEEVVRELAREQARADKRDEQKIAELINKRDALQSELKLAGKLEQQLAQLPQNLRSEFESLFSNRRFMEVASRATIKWQKGLELNDTESQALGLLSRKSGYAAYRTAVEQLLQDESLSADERRKFEAQLEKIEQLRRRGEDDPYYRMALNEAVEELRNVKPAEVQRRLTKADLEWLSRDAQTSFQDVYVAPYRQEAVNDAIRLLGAYKNLSKQWGHVFYTGEVEANAAKAGLQEVRKVAAGKLTTTEEIARVLQAMTQAAETGVVEASGAEMGPAVFQPGISQNSDQKGGKEGH
ncbi:MAG: hypothetical protein KatS3mg099_240 [Candidatus Parcubacteria bacterium]|nr:MAG: hypothetical protein KatS3mg099_240 [Candidatus Parcubacteria bacterium]